jgi:hypothetical protein
MMMSKADDAKQALIVYLRGTGTGENKLAIAAAADVSAARSGTEAVAAVIAHMRAEGVNPFTMAKAEAFVLKEETDGTDSDDTPNGPKEDPAGDSRGVEDGRGDGACVAPEGSSPTHGGSDDSAAEPQAEQVTGDHREPEQPVARKSRRKAK